MSEMSWYARQNRVNRINRKIIKLDLCKSIIVCRVPIAINKTCTHTIHIDSKRQRVHGVGTVYACFSKNTAEKPNERQRTREKNSTRLWPLDIYHSSAPASATTPSTIASTHIINPIQWHFTGERLLHRYSLTSPCSVRIWKLALSLTPFISLFADCMQNLFSHPMGNPFQKQKQNRKYHKFYHSFGEWIVSIWSSCGADSTVRAPQTYIHPILIWKGTKSI